MTRLKVWFAFAVAVLVILPNVLALYGIDRNCCRYRCPEGGECAPWCQDHNTCIIKNNSDTALVQDSGCSVMYDTKVDESTIKSKEDCLKKNFVARKSFDDLPFFIDPYVFKSSKNSHTPFIGLDLKYRYNMFDKLRFRFKNMNQNVCPENLSLEENSACNPRCVEIDKSASKPPYGLQQNRNILSYDCEVGFYKDDRKYMISSKHEYRLSICATHHGATKCGEFAFQMPSIKDMNEDRVLVLLDRQEFDRRDKIVIHVPTTQNPDAFHVSVLLIGDDNNRSTIFTQTVAVPHGAHNPMRIQLDHNIPSGRYQVAVIPLRGGNRTALPSYSAQLERPDYGQHALLIITIILLIIIIVGILLAGYKRRQKMIEESTIEPALQIKSGLLEPKSIFVITQLENTEHTQVVKELCAYMRTQCGITDTYYPLDEENGVLATTGGGSSDPWKWAQKSYEKVKENGTVVFIAGPSKSHAQGSALWPGIQESQMFLVEPDLIALYRQNRILVLNLPYSEAGSLPASLPNNITQQAAKQIPRDMNAVLVQLLQLEKQGCSCIGQGCVQPNIVPANLASRQAGISLMDKINKLSNKLQCAEEDKESSNLTYSNNIIHRILKREVRRNRRRSSLPPTTPTTLLSKSSPAIVSTETDRLLQDEKLGVVVGDNNQTINTTTTTLKGIQQQQQQLITTSDVNGQNPQNTLVKKSGSNDDGAGDGGKGGGGGGELRVDLTTTPTSTDNNRTIQIELEQNLLSIKSLMNRDKSSVEDV